MITIRRRTSALKDGRTLRQVFVRVTGESLTPLDVIPARVPEKEKGCARTGERVRVNRSGTWAIWSCIDTRAA